jgi:cytochrome oxidase Cu insertion factor (SCO1/SenC/PrrC family)
MFNPFTMPALRRMAAAAVAVALVALAAVVLAVPASANGPSQTQETSVVAEGPVVDVEARRASGRGRTVVVVVGAGAVLAAVLYRALKSKDGQQ